MEHGDISKSASELSQRGASKGGHARAEKLTPQERREIAITAANARWGEVQVATHVGRLPIGDTEIDCAVLNDGKRLLSQSTVLMALGRHPEKSRRSLRDGGAVRAPFLLAENLQPFISGKLHELSQPISYRVPGKGNRQWGYRAEILPMVCNAYLEARNQGKLIPSQTATARAAEILIRGLAEVGIVALVDEVTGYQEERSRYELQKILEFYVREELRPWVRRFPPDFFKEMYRLNSWEYKSDTTKRTPHAGKLVNKYIYDQLPPGVHDELRRKNPKNERGHRSHKHHQFLTEGTGIVHLDKQITVVLTLMRAAEDKNEFERLFERLYPPAQINAQVESPLGLESNGEAI